ncbi:MAG: CPBP family intramembrane metalloprotease [Erysipelotrichaceae bacterium]|nr:CPBP family intramembrane metalloprotease [Erysipelotrichaceae bacterium]
MDKREYLKPFRCFGGAMLAIGVITALFTLASSPLAILFSNASDLVTVLVTLYSYYLIYRIFIKKYHIALFPGSPVRKDRRWQCLLACVLAFAVIRFSWLLYYRLLARTPYWQALADEEGELSIFMILYVAILAPLAEEIVFRGWFLKVLRRYGTAVAVFFTAIAFGMMHGTVTQSIPAFFIGIVLAILAIRYESLVPGIILHVINNSLSFLTFNEEPLFVFYLVLMAVAIIMLLFAERRNLSRLPAQMKTFFRLSVSSISFILFMIIYVGLIVFDYVAMVRGL